MTVVISGVPCEGRHGAYAGERDVVRTFLVDVTARGASGDDAARIEAIAKRAVAARSRNLLERVAADVAAAVLGGIPSATAVTVRVVKPDPPGLGAASEAVSLSLARGGLRGAPAPSGSRVGPGGRRARG